MLVPEEWHSGALLLAIRTLTGCCTMLRGTLRERQNDGKTLVLIKIIQPIVQRIHMWLWLHFLWSLFTLPWLLFLFSLTTLTTFSQLKLSRMHYFFLHTKRRNVFHFFMRDQSVLSPLFNTYHRQLHFTVVRILSRDFFCS